MYTSVLMAGTCAADLTPFGPIMPLWPYPTQCVLESPVMPWHTCSSGSRYSKVASACSDALAAALTSSRFVPGGMAPCRQIPARHQGMLRAQVARSAQEHQTLLHMRDSESATCLKKGMQGLLAAWHHDCSILTEQSFGQPAEANVQISAARLPGGAQRRDRRHGALLPQLRPRQGVQAVLLL
jgi:hypothetical protein